MLKPEMSHENAYAQPENACEIHCICRWNISFHCKMSKKRFSFIQGPLQVSYQYFPAKTMRRMHVSSSAGCKSRSLSARDVWGLCFTQLEKKKLYKKSQTIYGKAINYNLSVSSNFNTCSLTLKKETHTIVPNFLQLQST